MGLVAFDYVEIFPILVDFHALIEYLSKFRINYLCSIFWTFDQNFNFT